MCKRGWSKTVPYLSRIRGLTEHKSQELITGLKRRGASHWEDHLWFPPTAVPMLPPASHSVRLCNTSEIFKESLCVPSGSNYNFKFTLNASLTVRNPPLRTEMLRFVSACVRQHTKQNIRFNIVYVFFFFFFLNHESQHLQIIAQCPTSQAKFWRQWPKTKTTKIQ